MKIVTLLLCLTGTLSANAFIQKEITIQVVGIPEAKGNILIGVYDNASSFGKVGKEIKLISIPADSCTVTTTVKDLEEKEYAFAVVHDANANGKCDYNIFGIPKESFGFSRNVKPKFRLPEFNDVKVKITDRMFLKIKLLRF